jgi:hypothetical protein
MVPKETPCMMRRSGVGMIRELRLRFTVEALLGTAAGALGLVTLFWQDWIEAILGVDPDSHDGSFEWLIVAGLLATAVVLGILARADLRRITAAPAPSHNPDPAS